MKALIAAPSKNGWAKRTPPLVLALGFAACATGTSPALSVAWDPNEGVRYLLAEGCLPAVENQIPVKQAIDRGQVMSRVRPLDASPLNDPPGTPAYAVLSSASVVITGDASRCRVASSSGEPEKLHQAALSAIKDGGWSIVPGAPSEAAAAQGISVEARCKMSPNGALLLTFFTATQPEAPLKFQAIASRSKAPSCTGS